jgi:hypothetical protein
MIRRCSSTETENPDSDLKKSMTLDELSRLVSTGEGLYLEFKRRMPAPERIAKEIVAFANTRGGKILLGVDDDGTIRGVKDIHEELFLFRRAVSTHCVPEVNFEVHAVSVTRRREVLVVDVPDSSEKPHFLKNEKNGASRNVAYVRVADESIEASREMVRLMRWSRKPRDTHFRFGSHEQLLMRYLETYQRITVRDFARVADLSEKEASWKLLLLTRAGILQVHPGEGADHFSLLPKALK